jgi:hypothetical protein
VTDEPRTYTGWKAGLAIVGATIVVAGGLNVLAKIQRDHERSRAPRPSVTSVAP